MAPIVCPQLLVVLRFDFHLSKDWGLSLVPLWIPIGSYPVQYLHNPLREKRLIMRKMPGTNDLSCFTKTTDQLLCQSCSWLLVSSFDLLFLSLKHLPSSVHQVQFNILNNFHKQLHPKTSGNYTCIIKTIAYF